MTDTLFGHLAVRFSTHPENLATEALGYILRRSVNAREALSAMLHQIGVTAAPGLTFQNQVGGEDGAQPDLVGLDESGAQRLIVEAKFWAGLTEHQPVTYLKRLPRDGGALIVLAPGARIAHLWPELLRRCSHAQLAGQPGNVNLDETRSLKFEDGRNLAVLSWRMLLDFLLLRLESANDFRTREDVLQLRGLCARMDNDAFIPVTSEELTTHVYRRIPQFGSIVDDVTRLLVEKGLGDTRGLRSAAGNGYYGRYLRLNGMGAFLISDVRKWMKYASTPLWLSVYGWKWRSSSPTPIRQALTQLEMASPPRMFMGGDGFPTVALFVPVGEERDRVIQSVFEQIEDVAASLEGLRPASGAQDSHPADEQLPVDDSERGEQEE